MEKLIVDTKVKDGKLNFLFSYDCGKFDTNEIIDEYDVNVEDLLILLQQVDITNLIDMLKSSSTLTALRYADKHQSIVDDCGDSKYLELYEICKLLRLQKKL